MKKIQERSDKSMDGSGLSRTDSAFVTQERDGIVFLTANNIGAHHAFTTRIGGVSEGPFASLNLGFNRGDNAERVRENYRRIGAAAGMDLRRLAFTRQVHGVTVRIVSEADAIAPGDTVPYEADGLVSNTPGLAMVCFGADCVPVLLYDSENRCAGAVHCGWRSFTSGILKNALEAMRSLGAESEHIRAAVGPGIGSCCFEVGTDVTAALEVCLPEDAAEFCEPLSGAENKYMLDLKGAIRRYLIRQKVPDGQIAVSGACTKCLPDKYWSHRGLKGGIRGTQAALIALPAEVSL